MVMSFEGAPELPPEPERRIPEFALVWRGLALCALSLAAVWGAVVTAKHALTLPVSVVFAVVAVLAGWAGAIQLTGGEKFDDHPWV